MHSIPYDLYQYIGCTHPIQANDDLTSTLDTIPFVEMVAFRIPFRRFFLHSEKSTATLLKAVLFFFK